MIAGDSPVVFRVLGSGARWEYHEAINMLVERVSDDVFRNDPERDVAIQTTFVLYPGFGRDLFSDANRGDERRDKLFFTMESLILAQDER